jgi:hypothetical protein
MAQRSFSQILCHIVALGWPFSSQSSTRHPPFWGLMGVDCAVYISINILFKATYVWGLRLSQQLFSPGSHQNCPSCLIQSNNGFSCTHIKTTPASVHNPVPMPLPCQSTCKSTPHFSFFHSDFVGPYCMHVKEYLNVGSLVKNKVSQVWGSELN